MKKLIFIFAAALFFTSCDHFPPEDRAYLWIKNCTDQPIKLDISDSVPSYLQKGHLVAAGDSVRMCWAYFHPQGGERPYFDAMLQRRLDRVDEQYRYINVLSGDGNLLKTWRYSDRDRPGKQFFNDSSWKYYESFIDGGKKEIDTIVAEWVFEIEPEDIVPATEDNM